MLPHVDYALFCFVRYQSLIERKFALLSRQRAACDLFLRSSQNKVTECKGKREGVRVRKVIMVDETAK